MTEQKINELATPEPAPQEAIFDANGWCRDIDLAPKEKVIILLLKNTYGHTVTVSTIRNYAVFSCYNKIKAWRPLPETPTVK